MNATSHSLKGQIALVTGAASGIGAAIAVVFARAGGRICVNYDTNREGAEGDGGGHSRGGGRRCSA